MRQWVLDDVSAQGGSERWLKSGIVIYFRAADAGYRVALVREAASRKLFAIANPHGTSELRELQRDDFEDLYVRCIAARALGASLTVEIDL